MLRQKDFYKFIETLGGGTRVQAPFRQVGDIFEAGFLPDKSGGTCSYTTLDFHRAVSQGSEREWMETAGAAKKASSIWQSTFGAKGNDFGRRQQIHFTSQDEVIKDPLYLRSLSPERQAALDSGVIGNSRRAQSEFECFNPRDLIPQVAGVLDADPQAAIRISFDVIEKNKQGDITYGHTIGICQSRDGQSLYVMDPNVGVISTNRAQLPLVLEGLRAAVYKDYTLGPTKVEIQDKFWLDPAQPFTAGDVQRFRQEEAALLTRITEAEYKAHLAKQTSAPVDDCAFDDAVFDDEAWEAAPPVEVAAAAVAVGAHEYHEQMARLRAPAQEPTPALTTAQAAADNTDPDDEWDIVNAAHQP